MAGKTWRFELYYWDYVIGVFIFSLLFALTVGSNGEYGRGFLADLAQASPQSLGFAFLGGVVSTQQTFCSLPLLPLPGCRLLFR